MNQETFPNIKSLLFDMDGVLFESARIRDEAFVYVFDTIGCHEENRVLEIHRNNFGMYRKEKLSLIYKEVFNSAPSEVLIQDLYDRFSAWVVERVISSPFVPGTLQFLRTKGDLPCYVVSAAPEEEVLHIIKKRNIDNYFVGIFGAPTKKRMLIEMILKSKRWRPQTVIFIGDRISDWKASQEAGTRFIGRVKANEENPFPAKVPIIKDLFELSNILT